MSYSHFSFFISQKWGNAKCRVFQKRWWEFLQVLIDLCNYNHGLLLLFFKINLKIIQYLLPYNSYPYTQLSIVKLESTEAYKSTSSGKWSKKSACVLWKLISQLLILQFISLFPLWCLYQILHQKCIMLWATKFKQHKQSIIACLNLENEDLLVWSDEAKFLKTPKCHMREYEILVLIFILVSINLHIR